MTENPLIKKLQGEYKLHSFLINFGSISIQLRVEVLKLTPEVEIDGKTYQFVWFRHSSNGASIHYMETLDNLEVAAFNEVLTQTDAYLHQKKKDRLARLAN